MSHIIIIIIIIITLIRNKRILQLYSVNNCVDCLRLPMPMLYQRFYFQWSDHFNVLFDNGFWRETKLELVSRELAAIYSLSTDDD